VEPPWRGQLVAVAPSGLPVGAAVRTRNFAIPEVHMAQTRPAQPVRQTIPAPHKIPLSLTVNGVER